MDLTSTTHHETPRSDVASGWGPVLSGAAAAFLTFASFSALWLAIAASGAAWMSGSLAWFELATALVAAAVGGLVTGRLQDGGRDRGAMRGFAAWGLVLIAGLVVGVPATTAVFAGATNVTLQTVTQGGDISTQLSGLSGELWSTFIIFAGGGLLAAVTGGAAATTTSEDREVVTERDTTRARAGHHEPATNGAY